MTIAQVSFNISKGTTTSLATSWQSGHAPIANNLLVIRGVAGNALSVNEVITDPSGALWTPVYGTQPNTSSGANRGAIQAYIRKADGTANDNAPTITLSSSSRGIFALSEYSASLGWPTIASILEQIYTAGAGTSGTNPSAGSGTAGASTLSALILAWALSINSSQTWTWANSLASEGSDIQGTANAGFASRIVTSSTTISPNVTLGSAGNLYEIGAFAVKENAATSTEIGSWGVAAA